MYLHGARDINEAITSIDPNASCDFFTNVWGSFCFCNVSIDWLTFYLFIYYFIYFFIYSFIIIIIFFLLLSLFIFLRILFMEGQCPLALVWTQEM